MATVNVQPLPGGGTEEERRAALQENEDRQLTLSPEAQQYLGNEIALGGRSPEDAQRIYAEIQAYKAAKERQKAVDQRHQEELTRQAYTYTPFDPQGVRNAAQMQGLADWQKRMQGEVEALKGQSAPQMTAAQAVAARLGTTPQMQAATIDQSQQAQFRDQQMALAQQLAQAAQGNGASAAQAQLKLATDRNMAQALALGLGARGGNQAAAMKQAQMQRAMMSQEAGAQSAALRAQEIQAAQQALGNVTAQGRGMDIALASDQAALQQGASQANLGAQVQYGLQQGAFDQQANMTNAGFQQDAAKTNLGATLAQRQMVADKTQQYMAMGLGADMAQYQAQLDAEKYIADQKQREEMFRLSYLSANRDRNDAMFMNLMNGIMGMGTSMMGMGATGMK